MLNVKKMLTKVLNRMTDYIVVEKKNIPITWQSTNNAYFATNIDITKSGYTPIGIVGWAANGTLASFVIFPRLVIGNNRTLYIEARNNQTVASITQNSAEVYIAYMKS